VTVVHPHSLELAGTQGGWIQPRRERWRGSKSSVDARAVPAAPLWLAIGLETGSPVGSEMGSPVGSGFFVFLIY
jgi:hypothetical protein